MDDDSLEVIERQLASAVPMGAPPVLRSAVLADVRRELRSATWDRRLARAAVVLLVIGVGLNVAIGVRTAALREGLRPAVAQSSSQQSLVDTAIVVAEATDVATGIRFVRQLAAMSGHDLTGDEAAEIDAAVEQAVPHGTTNRNKG